jgi:hypothetical protein
MLLTYSLPRVYFLIFSGEEGRIYCVKREWNIDLGKQKKNHDNVSQIFMGSVVLAS